MATTAPELGIRQGFSAALRLFHEAAHRVPAYKAFLASNGISPAKIKTMVDFRLVPPINKSNYITQHSLAELSWDGVMRARYVSSSSGSTGHPFYWPRGEYQDRVVTSIFKSILGEVLEVDQGKTLIVDCFGLGTWIAGLELYNAVRDMIGWQVTIVTPGVDKEAAVGLITSLATDFDQIVICSYPPFAKDILDFGEAQGIDWKQLNVYLLTAGEAITEGWRSRMSQKLGNDNLKVINYYGMAESGTLAFETPLSIWLRHQQAELATGPLFELFGGHDMTSIFQFNPLQRYFEASDEGLLLTSRAGLPLVRYQTRDYGSVVSWDKAMAVAKQEIDDQDKITDLFTHWHLPFVYLTGRRDLSILLYAANVYPDNIKAALDLPDIAKSVSGIFIMRTKLDSSMNPYLQIEIELAPGQTKSTRLAKMIANRILDQLLKLNSEYRKLYDSIGRRAAPQITLLPFGSIDYTPGKKHKWALSA